LRETRYVERDHPCIRDCGRLGLFLKKYRMNKSQRFMPMWLCIECLDEFETQDLPYMKCPCDFCELVRKERCLF